MPAAIFEVSLPQLERRRALRRQKRQQLLIHTWRTVALLSPEHRSWLVAAALRLVATGPSGGGPRRHSHKPELLCDVSKLRFPQPLLAINPTMLERTLLDNLPVQSVQVSRRLLPTRLEVTLVDQTPVARAFRQQAGGLEAGFVDREGQWIQINPAAPSASPSTAISIRGWTPERRALIASLLEQQNRFKGRIQIISLHPDGAISLAIKPLDASTLAMTSNC